MSFPGLAHDSKIEISNKIGWLFQENGLADDTENENFSKNSG